MTVLLVGFKLSIGIAPIYRIVAEALEERNIRVVEMGDPSVVDVGTGIGVGSSSDAGPWRIALDTLNPMSWLRIASCIVKARPSVLVFISVHPLNIVAALLCRCVGRRVRIVSQIHDPVPHSGTWYAWFIKVVQKIQCSLSDKIIVAGYRLKSLVGELYGIPEHRISVVPFGVFRPDISYPPVRSEPQYVSLLGRLEWYKGIDVFLEAVHVLLRKRKVDLSGVKFVIAGKGDLSRLKKQIECLPSEILLIWNRVLSDDEFDAVLRRSYACVLPYRDGTQTGIIPIAYYNACPVIVTNVGSLPENVIDGVTGLVIPPENPSALAEAIEYILADPTRWKEMSKNAFVMYRERFTSARFGSDMVMEILSVCG